MLTISPAASCPHGKFPLGALYVTAEAERILDRTEIERAVSRHYSGDWGDAILEDKAANDRALLEGTRLFSVYHDTCGVKFWIITEADRSMTTVLLPSDY